MTMQEHNNHNNDEAPQTGRTTSTNTIEPCLKSNNQPYSRQQRMIDDDENGSNKQQHNNQTVHGRGRRKTVAMKGNLTNGHVNQSTQQSTNNRGERMGSW
jgi:hypothetical protein